MTEPLTPEDVVGIRKELKHILDENPRDQDLGFFYKVATRALDEVVRLNSDLENVYNQPEWAERIQKERAQNEALRALIRVAVQEIEEGIDHAVENVEGAPSHETLKLLRQVADGYWLRVKIINLDGPSPMDEEDRRHWAEGREGNP